MKTESIENWQKRTGKKPTKLKISESNQFGWAWLIKGDVKLKTKGDKSKN